MPGRFTPTVEHGVMPALFDCPECGVTVTEDDRDCPSCGASVP